MKGSEAYHEIVKTFGENIVNPESGEIERRKLGTIVFSDKVSNSLVMSPDRQTVYQHSNLLWYANSFTVHANKRAYF